MSLTLCSNPRISLKRIGSPYGQQEARTANDNSENEFKAKITNVSYYGDMTYYSVEMPGPDDDISISMRNTVGRHVYSVGDVVRIGWGAESIVAL